MWLGCICIPGILGSTASAATASARGESPVDSILAALGVGSAGSPGSLCFLVILYWSTLPYCSFFLGPPSPNCSPSPPSSARTVCWNVSTCGLLDRWCWYSNGYQPWSRSCWLWIWWWGRVGRWGWVAWECEWVSYFWRWEFGVFCHAWWWQWTGWWCIRRWWVRWDSGTDWRWRSGCCCGGGCTWRQQWHPPQCQ